LHVLPLAEFSGAGPTPKGGEATTGIARIRDGLAATEATGTRSQAPLLGALLAEALALARRTEEGLPPWTTHWQKRPPLAGAGTQKFIACAASSPLGCRIPNLPGI
jgi:hypothetical protein